MENRYAELQAGVRLNGNTVMVSIVFPTDADAAMYAAEIGRELMTGRLNLEVEFTPLLGSA